MVFHGLRLRQVDHACALVHAERETGAPPFIAGTFTETEQGEIRFPDIPATVLEKVCQYFYYKLKYQHAPPNT